MAKFVYIYHGGGAPPDPADAASVMAKWGAWMSDASTVQVSAGSPVGQSTTVTANGVEDNGGSNPVSGYNLVEAPDLAAAIAKAQSCPILESGGTVEIAPEMSM